MKVTALSRHKAGQRNTNFIINVFCRVLIIEYIALYQVKCFTRYILYTVKLRIVFLLIHKLKYLFVNSKQKKFDEFPLDLVIERFVNNNETEACNRQSSNHQGHTFI